MVWEGVIRLGLASARQARDCERYPRRASKSRGNWGRGGRGKGQVACGKQVALAVWVHRRFGWDLSKWTKEALWRQGAGFGLAHRFHIFGWIWLD